MRALSESERSAVRHSVVAGLMRLGVNADPHRSTMLTDPHRSWLVGQIVDTLHKLGRSAEITPELLEREGRWMVAELQDAGVMFAPFAYPPDPYAAALEGLRANAATPCDCYHADEVVTGYAPPDPYARALTTMKKEQR